MNARNLERVVGTIDRLDTVLGDAGELLDMAAEEGDEQTVESVNSAIWKRQPDRIWPNLEFRRMFSGEMDDQQRLSGYPGGLRWYRSPGLGQHAAAHVPALG